MIFACITAIELLIIEVNYEEDDESQKTQIALYNYTLAVVVSLILMLIEFPNQLKIFDFFSPFCRALAETVYDSTQILIMLTIIVFF